MEVEEDEEPPPEPMEEGGMQKAAAGGMVPVEPVQKKKKKGPSPATEHPTTDLLPPINPRPSKFWVGRRWGLTFWR
jgi:hypothetical protein